MATTFSNNVISSGNSRLFSFGTNQTSRFEIGEKDGEDAWLQAEFVGPNRDEPVFNGRLFHAGADGETTIIDNFPKSDTPDGWRKEISPDHDGYSLVDDMGNIVFSYKDTGEGNVLVQLKIFGRGGQVVANTTSEALHVYNIPVKM